MFTFWLRFFLGCKSSQVNTVKRFIQYIQQKTKIILNKFQKKFFFTFSSYRQYYSGKIIEMASTQIAVVLFDLKTIADQNNNNNDNSCIRLSAMISGFCAGNRSASSCSRTSSRSRYRTNYSSSSLTGNNYHCFDSNTIYF